MKTPSSGPTHGTARQTGFALPRLTAGLLGLGATALIGACSSLGFGEAERGDDGFVVGQNLVAEDCRAVPNGQDRVALRAEEVFNIQCGQWESPSAQVAVFDRDTVGESGQPGAWSERLNRTAQCGSLEQTVEWAGGTGRGFSCTLRAEGAWPYEARLFERGGKVYGIQGIPAAMIPAEFAAGVLAGVTARNDLPNPVQIDQTRLDYESRIGARVFSVGDVFSFMEVMDYARYLNAQGLHADALVQYQEALGIQQRFLPGDDPRLAEVLMVLAIENSNLERFEQAEVQFRRAERLVPNAIDPNLQARLQSYRAFHLANQRQFSEALSAAARASARREEIIDTYLRGGLNAPTGEFSERRDAGGDLGTIYGLTALADLLQSRYLEGAMLRRLGRRDEALRTVADAERAISQYPKLAFEWQQKLRLLRASIAEDEGRLGEARAIMGQIIEEERARSVDSHLAAVTLVDRGRLAFEAGDRTAGFEDTEAGLEIIARARQDLPLNALAPFYNAVLEDQARGVTDALLAQTFAYGQLARSTVVGQTMRQSFARLAAENSAGGQAIRDLQDLRRLRDELTAQISLAEAQGDTARAQNIRRAFEASEARLAEREQAVQSALPRYNLIVDEPVTLDTLQASLRQGEGVVLFQVAEARSYGFLVTRSDIDFFAVEQSEKALGDLIRKVRFAVDDRPGAAYDLATAAQLHRALFGPVKAKIDQLSHIVVAPTGPLQSLPFSMLVASSDGRPRRTYEGVDWMIRRHAVSVVPSVQAFHLNRTGARSRPTRVPFAGFVGGTYGAPQQAGLTRRLNLPTSCEGDLAALLDLPPLAGAAGEVASIVERVGADRAQTYSLEQLTEDNIKSLPLQDFRVMHFAAHGLFPGELDCLPQPAIVVGLPESGGGDGLLTATEITNLSLNADLVVLSACNTGVVLDKFGGESLASLSRSFFYAGAKGLLVSHWYVSDEATKLLMVGVFDRLKGGASAVEAVRQAKLAMIDNPRTSHPFFWSAFSYLGDGADAIDL